MWYIYITEYYPAIKNQKIWNFQVNGSGNNNFECIITDPERQMSHIFSDI